MKRFTFFSILLFVLVCTAPNLQAQQFDYEKYPRLDFDITHLELDIEVAASEGTIKGTAGYSLKANIAGADTLVLHAAHIEVESVTVNDNPAEFSFQNDSLLVLVSDSTARNEEFSLSVDYQAVPRFGILANDRGTLWTSLLPESHRHWLPVLDHPREELTASMNFTVPSDFSVLASGRKRSDQISNIDQSRYSFSTQREVAVTALSFAIGDFEQRETSFGIKKIVLAAERGMLSQERQTALLQSAYDMLEKLEQRLDIEYPWEQLNIVLMEDHLWETKSWGAGTVFLYENAGSLETQLKRGIYGQWFGVYQREEQWQDAEAVNLLQAALHDALNDTVALLDVTDMPESKPGLYSVFSYENWNSWQEGRARRIDDSWFLTVKESLQELSRRGKGVYSFADYSEYWYRQTGQPRFTLQENTGDTREASTADSVVYRVDYRLNEQEGELRLIFESLQGSYDELVTLPVEIRTSEGTEHSEVTFTGARDSVMIRVPVLVGSVSVDASGREMLRLEQYKPAPFLIHDLRNAEELADRVEAARKLGTHTDNPDLQLAIMDLLNRGVEPPVRAALLRSLADITKGASGTESVFLEALRSGNAKVQEAGLSALQNFEGNSAVLESVRSYAEGVDSLPAFRDAARVLNGIADSTSFKEFVNNRVRTDTAGHKAIFAVQLLANRGYTEQAVQQAAFYLSDVYDYPVRARALEILFQHDHQPEQWRERAGELLDDPDPRLRFLIAEGLSSITGLEYEEIVRNHIQDEYDARVHRALSELINE